MHIKAIETRYAGYRFRSRLEARWAVFFDAIGVAYKYEDEGFEWDFNGRKERYLPDFYLPEWGVYVEVKPGVPTCDEMRKLHVLAAAQPEIDGRRKIHFMICGSPGLPKLRLNHPPVNSDLFAEIGKTDSYMIVSTSGSLIDGKPDCSISAFSTMNDKPEAVDVFPFYVGDCKLRLNRTYEPVNPKKTYQQFYSPSLFLGVKKHIYMGNGRSFDSSFLRNAYERARSARFEHGERK